MKKFNKAINIKTTKVLINDEWYKVVYINDTRINIKVDGLVGSFQRGHVTRYTNKRELME